MEQEKIQKFLDDFGVAVMENEPSHYVELMMDDHYCIQYNGVQYYVPKNHGLYTKDDYDFLQELQINYSL